MAAYLLNTLDKQVELIEQYANAGAERHILLKEALTQYFLAELNAIDCDLPEAQCRELLEVDIELNAQGLAVWCDKK
jgi:hypothetical protein